MTDFVPLKLTLHDPLDVWLGMVLDTIDAIGLQAGDPPLPNNIKRYMLSLAMKGRIGDVTYDAKGLADWYAAQDKYWIVPRTPVPEGGADADPAAWDVDRLRVIRGALWTRKAPIPTYGPRPGQPDNICAMGAFDLMPRDVQAMMIAAYRPYTHCDMGPFVDPGYHNQWPSSTLAQWDLYLDSAQQLWNAGIAQVHFLKPDAYSFDDCRRNLEPLFTSDRAQRLMRMVCLAWEPTQYGWSNATWKMWLQWQADVFPHALRYVHTVCDTDALVGVDARGDDNATLKGDWGRAWSNITPLIHGWLVQNCAFEKPDQKDAEGHTNRENFVAQFSSDVQWQRSLVQRFRDGHAGWPQFSAFGNQPIDVIAAEFASYWVYWNNRPEAEAQAWGDDAIRAGAIGCFDGCTLL